MLWRCSRRRWYGVLGTRDTSTLFEYGAAKGAVGALDWAPIGVRRLMDLGGGHCELRYLELRHQAPCDSPGV